MYAFVGPIRGPSAAALATLAAGESGEAQVDANLRLPACTQPLQAKATANTTVEVASQQADDAGDGQDDVEIGHRGTAAAGKRGVGKAGGLEKTALAAADAGGQGRLSGGNGR